MKIQIGNGLILYMIMFPEFRRTAERFNKKKYWQQVGLYYRNDADSIVNDHITISKTEYGYYLF